MHPDPDVEEWANFLVDQSWDNIDELAEIIVARINSQGG